MTPGGPWLAATTQWRSIGANLTICTSSRITDSSTHRCQRRRAAFTLSRWRYPACPPQRWRGERRTRASHTSTRYWTNAVWRSASWPACRRAIGTNCWSVNQRVSTHIVCSFDMYMIIVNLEGKWNDKSKQQKKTTSLQRWGHFSVGTKFKAVSSGAETQSIRTAYVTGESYWLQRDNE